MSRKSKAAEFVDEGWDVRVTGRHMSVTDAMKDYALAKISKMDKFKHRIIEVDVVMDIQRQDHKFTLSTKIDNTTFRCSAVTTDMYASIDKAVVKLTEQFLRYKSRITDHHLAGQELAAMNVNIYSPVIEEVEVNDEIEAENNERLLNAFGSHKIVKKETCPLRTLTNSESIIRMELKGEPFMIFRGEEDQKIKVIYRREDGHYGIIEPE